MNEIEKMRSDLERLQQRIEARLAGGITEDDPVIARMIGRKVGLERALLVIEPMRAEVEQLQKGVQAEKSVKETIIDQRNRAYEVNDTHLKRISLLERERDQLKAILQQFMALNQHDRDLPLELFAIQRSVSAKAVSLAAHDAEVIERAAGELFSGTHQLQKTAHKRLCDYANQLRQQAKEVQS